MRLFSHRCFVCLILIFGFIKVFKGYVSIQVFHLSKAGNGKVLDRIRPVKKKNKRKNGKFYFSFVFVCYRSYLHCRKIKTKGIKAMEAILKKYRFLSDEQFGKMIKLSISYLSGEELKGSAEDLAFFEIYFKKEISNIIRNRKKSKKYMRKKKGQIKK